MTSSFGIATGGSQDGIFLGYQCRKPGGTYSVCRKNRSSPFGRTISCFASMAKMPHSCEDHRQPSLIRGCDHLIVADGTAGLDHGCRACLYSCQQPRSEEHTSELQSLMSISYAVFCYKKKNTIITDI